MRKAIVIVVVAGLLLSGWLVYARYEARQAVYRAARAKRDAAYQVVLAQFQRDLQLSMPRSGVKRYLDLKQVSYSEWEWTIRTKIADESGDGFTCDRWGIYVDFHFYRTQGQLEPSEFDHLDSIAITKIGHCL